MLCARHIHDTLPEKLVHEVNHIGRLGEVVRGRVKNVLESLRVGNGHDVFLQTGLEATRIDYDADRERTPKQPFTACTLP
jgi:hypothetical protein